MLNNFFLIFYICFRIWTKMLSSCLARIGVVSNTVKNSVRDYLLLLFLIAFFHLQGFPLAIIARPGLHSRHWIKLLVSQRC